jgi:hypothetical protein
VILWRDAVDFTTGPEDAARSEVQAMVNMAGADHLSELDLGDEHEVECHRVDYGPAGLLGLRRIVIYGELGLTPPASAPQPAAAGGDPTRTAPPAPAAAPFDADAVRDALRSLSRSLELARNPLATGATPDERAVSVRARVEAAAEHAFGDSDDEQLLRAVLRRGYLEPSGSHEQAAHELFLSRATYFRRLRTAAGRLADYLVASQ